MMYSPNSTPPSTAYWDILPWGDTSVLQSLINGVTAIGTEFDTSKTTRTQMLKVL
jgi:hypothetical protein